MKKTLIVGILGVCGGVLLLLGLLLPWYPASGRYTFSAFTLLMNRQEGPLLLHAFLLIFGGFAFIGGGALARFLPRRDLTIVLLAGVVLSSIGVALSMVYLMAGFNLTNPLPGLYVFTCTSIRLEALLADMSHGFYVSLAGIAAGLAGCVLSAAGERVKTKSPRKN